MQHFLNHENGIHSNEDLTKEQALRKAITAGQISISPEVNPVKTFP